MIEWQWVVSVGVGSFLLGMIVGMVRMFCWHYKKTGKWIHEEKSNG